MPLVAAADEEEVTTTRAAALRWRARVAQKHHRIDWTVSRDDDDDDNNNYIEDYAGTPPSGVESSQAHSHQQQQNTHPLRHSSVYHKKKWWWWWRSPMRPGRLEKSSSWVLSTGAAAAAGTITLYAATVVTRTWWMAVTATLQLILIVGILPWQRRFLRRHASPVQQHQQWMQQKLQQLWKENHVWTRRLEQFDTELERVRQLQGQLAHLTVNDDDDDDNDEKYSPNGSSSRHHRLERLMCITQQFQSVRAQIVQCLRHQVQQEILLAAAAAGDGSTSGLEGAALERLIVRLRALPGVVLNESALRDACVQTTTTTSELCSNSNNNKTTRLVPLLLKHAQDDESQNMRGTRVLFSWEPVQLLKQHKRTPKLKEQR